MAKTRNQVRLDLLDAAAIAKTASDMVHRLAKELVDLGDDIPISNPTPLPFKQTHSPKKSGVTTVYSHVALSNEIILRHLKKAYDEATTDDEREAAKKRMQDQVDSGPFTSEDFEEYLG